MVLVDSGRVATRSTQIFGSGTHGKRGSGKIAKARYASTREPLEIYPAGLGADNA